MQYTKDNVKWPYAWIIITGFLLYFQTLSFGFVSMDDVALIFNRYKFISNLSNVLQSFQQSVFHTLPPFDCFYRPILTVSLMCDAHFGGINPFAYHLTNVLIHLTASCLVYNFLLKLKCEKAPALWLSLIFTVHPVLSQAVAWIPGRNDSLLAVFVFLSFIFFLNFLERKKPGYYLLHILFFLIAILTKETAVMLPIICALYIVLIYREKAPPLRLIIMSGGWLAIIFTWLILRKDALGSEAGLPFYKIVGYIFTNSPFIIQYIGKTILPVNLSVLPIIKDSTFVYGLVAIGLLSLVFFLSKKARYNYVLFGLSWFILFLLPAIIRVKPVPLHYFFEHRIYLPMAGFIIIISELYPFKGENKRITIISASSVIVILCIISFLYTENFKDRLTFWRSAVRTSSSSSTAHMGLGIAYHQMRGMSDEAQLEYKKALERNPTISAAHKYLGMIYMSKDMLKEAEKEFRKELVVEPKDAETYFNTGLLCFKEGRLSEGETMWKKAIGFDPEYLDAYLNLAIYYYKRGDLKQSAYYTGQLKLRGVRIDEEFLKTAKI